MLESKLAGRLDTLVRQGEVLAGVVEGSARDIEDKMKDVRSLLLAETQVSPASTSNIYLLLQVPRIEVSRWQDRLEGLEVRQQEVLHQGFLAIDKKITEANRVRLDTLNVITSKMKEVQKGEERAEVQLVELDTVRDYICSSSFHPPDCASAGGAAEEDPEEHDVRHLCGHPDPGGGVRSQSNAVISDLKTGLFLCPLTNFAWGWTSLKKNF